MKLSIRKSIAAAVMTMAATVGVTVGTAAPASASSCTEINYVTGTSRQTSSYRYGYGLEVSPTLRLTTSGDCSMFTYRYTAYVYTKDGTILAQKTVNGAWSGQVSFGALNAGVVSWDTDVIGVGIKTEFYYFGNGSWMTSEKDGWGVKVPGYYFNTSTGYNVVSGSSCQKDPDVQYTMSYHEWCKLPF